MNPFPDLTDAALAQILLIRADYEAAFPDDPPDTLAIGRGRVISADRKSSHPQVAAAFFRRSEINDSIRAGRGELHGIPCIILTPLEDKLSFAGKTLDFNPKRAFFVIGET